MQERQGRQGRKAWWAAALVAVLAVAGALWATGHGGLAGLPGMKGAASAPGAAASAPLQFRADEVLRPQRQALPQLITFSGPLVAPGTALLKAKAGGTLLALDVAEGDRVKRGQVLGRIDLADLGSRIAERSALIDAARASLQQAERNHASNQSLAQQQFISSSALDASRAALDSARASLQAAQAALATTRVAQQDGVLLAPITGIVAKRHVLPGEKVAPEQAVLTLVDLRQLELAGTVGTHEVARLAPGMALQVQVEGLDQPLNARLARIAPAAEAGTRAIGVTVALANADERLRAGQYAVARVWLPDAQQRLTLPLAAVGGSTGDPQVWAVVDGRLLRRAVTLGRRDELNGRVEVLTGLSDDSHVLAARFDNLREGAPVVVLPPSAAAPASVPPPPPASAPAAAASR